MPATTTTTKESTLHTPDGKSLHIKSWHPASSSSSSSSSSQPIARICFLHGFSDHSDRYASFFPLLSAAGVIVHALDQRGWGRSCSQSPSERGRTGPTSQVMRDITSFLDFCLGSGQEEGQEEGRGEGGEVVPPVYLMGHSMGGQETLYYAATGPVEVRRRLAGYIVVGPWVQLHPRTQPGWLKIRAGRWVAKWMPDRQLRNELDASVLSHSKEDNESWKADELCHDLGTLQGLDGALTRADELHHGVVKVRDQLEEGRRGTRLLLVHGGEDMVTSAVAAREWWEKCEVRDKRCEIYEGVYHNVHVDAPERLRDDVLEFIHKARTNTVDVSVVKS